MSMKRALVVDDDPQICQLSKAVLTRAGYQIDCAYDGEQALQQLNKSNYDVLLLDLMMPKMSGYDVIQQLAATKPGMLERTILVTANIGADVIALKQTGLYDVVHKPYDIDQLIRKVNACASQE